MENKDFFDKISLLDDPEFVFESEGHTYHYKGNKLRSVTNFIGSLKKPFDEDYWSNLKATEWDMNQEDVLKMWHEENRYANELGTEVHYAIELFLDGRQNELKKEGFFKNPESKERFKNFLKFYKRSLYRFETLKLEQKIFSTNLGLAGTVDLVCKYKDQIVLGDWKTNKKWGDDSSFCYNFLAKPFDDLWENKHNEYSIQLSFYRVMLEEWGIPTAGAFLCWIPPVVSGDNDEEKEKINKNKKKQLPEARFITAKDFTQRIKDYYYKKQIS